MKRFLLVAATATLAALMTGPPAVAQTAAPDPVRALQKQLKAERGVKLTELVTSSSGATATRTRAKGGVQLSPGGPVAAYTSMEEVDGDGVQAEMLAFPRHIYIGGEAFATLLPQGKTWLGGEARKETRPMLPLAAATQQPINVFDPAVLRATLRGERPKKVSGGHLYQGVVTYKELYEAAKAYYGVRYSDGKPSREQGKATVSYRLWVDDAGLLQRLRTHENLGSAEFKMATTVDTRYTDWGHLLVISPPAADEVGSIEEFENRQVSLPDPLEDPLLKGGLLGIG